jgi:hypothetical protein
MKVSPNVDYYGTISVTLSDDRCTAHVAFEGMIEPYPAFEMYAGINGAEQGQPIFQLDIAPDATVADITGDANRPVSVVTQVAVV